MLKIDLTEEFDVSLKDLLGLIENGHEFYWKILSLEACGDLGKKSIIELENQIKNSKDGFSISWNDLISLSNSLNQTIEILLIGDRNKINLKRYNSDKKMLEYCSICIELIDSSFWEISILEEELLDSIISGTSFSKE